MKTKLRNLIVVNGWYYVVKQCRGVHLRKAIHVPVGEERRACEARDKMLASLPLGLAERGQVLSALKGQLTSCEEQVREQLKRPEAGLPLSEAFKQFANTYDRLACGDRQLDCHRANWQQFLSWLKSSRPDMLYLRQLDKRTMLDYADWLHAHSKSSGAFNHHVKSVKYILRLLSEHDDEFVNPSQTLKSVASTDVAGKQPFTEQELIAIFGCDDKEFVLFAAIGLYTTLRFTSAKKLHWSQFTDNLEYLEATHEKTGVTANMRVPTQLRELLSKCENRTGYVLPTYGALGTLDANRLFMSKLKSLGIETQKTVCALNGTTRTACIKGFHSLRHTAITRALEAGKTPAQVKRLAGHVSDAMQQRYSHLSADAAGDAAEAIGKFW